MPSKSTPAIAGHPLVLTVNEARAKLRISHVTIYRLLSAGKLRRVKFGAATRIPFDDVQRLAQEGWQ